MFENNEKNLYLNHREMGPGNDADPGLGIDAERPEIIPEGYRSEKIRINSSDRLNDNYTDQA